LSATELYDASRASARRRQMAIIVVVFLVVLLLDQVTKAIISHTIPENSVSFVGREREFFFFTHQRNSGLVGGMFDNRPVVALAAPLFATLVLIYLFRHLDPVSRLQALAYGMIAGGAVGNLVDRLLREGGVVDFLQFHFWFVPFDFPWKIYPAFNVADSAICVGVFLLIVSWRAPENKDASSPA
jgi:signal peptidase II